MVAQHYIHLTFPLQTHVMQFAQKIQWLKPNKTSPPLGAILLQTLQHYTLTCKNAMIYHAYICTGDHDSPTIHTYNRYIHILCKDVMHRPEPRPGLRFRRYMCHYIITVRGIVHGKIARKIPRKFRGEFFGARVAPWWRLHGGENSASPQEGHWLAPGCIGRPLVLEYTYAACTSNHATEGGNAGQGWRRWRREHSSQGNANPWPCVK